MKQKCPNSLFLVNCAQFLSLYVEDMNKITVINININSNNFLSGNN